MRSFFEWKNCKFMTRKNVKLEFVACKFGFTLIELLVVVAIVGVLAVGAMFTLNPSKQIEKAQDAARVQGLAQIKDALEIYYHDKKCYPLQNSTKPHDFADALQNGTEWSEAKTVYMKKFPLDPATKKSFIYKVEDSACPQWEIVFAKLDKPAVSSNSCALSSLSNCKPDSYDQSWACSVAGNIDCASVQSYKLPAITPTPNSSQPTATNTPVPPTPTPTPRTETYTIAMNTDPYFTAASINPYPVAQGEQRFTIDAAGKNDIVSIIVTITTDTKKETATLNLTSGNPKNGTWSGSWTITDTIHNRYLLHIEATDSSGTKVATEVAFK